MTAGAQRTHCFLSTFCGKAHILGFVCTQSVVTPNVDYVILRDAAGRFAKPFSPLQAAEAAADAAQLQARSTASSKRWEFSDSARPAWVFWRPQLPRGPFMKVLAMLPPPQRAARSAGSVPGQLRGARRQGAAQEPQRRGSLSTSDSSAAIS